MAPSQRPLRLSPTTLLLLLLLAASTVSAAATALSSPAIQDGLITRTPSTCLAAQHGYTHSTFPWTHHPACIDTAAPHDTRRGQRFCTYTNAAYNHGRGISLVVTPDVAASFILATYDGALGGLDGMVGEERGVWRVEETQGRGRGVFVRGHVAGVFAGESVIVNTPVLFVAREMLARASEAQKEELLSHAIANLPHRTSSIVRGLAKTWGGPQAVDIVRTNSLEVKWPWVDHVPALLAVTPEVAMINHACRPNAFWRFNDDTLAFEVVAMQDIKPGQELTLSYGFSNRAHGRRTRSLKEHFGFTCQCATCSASPSSISLSNERLSEIKALKAALPSAYTDSPRLLGLLPPLIKSLEDEGLLTEMPVYEEMLALAWSSVGGKRRARYWAGRAERHWGIVTGARSWERRRCEELERHVEGHATWRTWRGEPWEGEREGEHEREYENVESGDWEQMHEEEEGEDFE